jgi:hypothetical protein
MLLGLLDAGGVVLGLGTAGSIWSSSGRRWARSRYRYSARYRAGAALLMDVAYRVHRRGRHAGPRAVEAYARVVALLRQHPARGRDLVTTALAVGTIVARYLLKMSPLMTLGGLVARVCTPVERCERRAATSFARLHQP